MQIVLKPATTSSHRAVSYGEVHCPFLYAYTRLPTHTCTRHARYTGSLGFEDVDAQSFVEWGFDFVKHDTCGGYNGTSRTSHELRFTAMRLSLGARKMVLFTAAGCGRGHSFQPPDIILLGMCACTFQFMRTCAFMVTYCILAFIVLYKGEPYDECGVGNDASGFNCIKNSTSAMSKALQKYGQQANKKIVYYIDHGRATAVNVWPSIPFSPPPPPAPFCNTLYFKLTETRTPTMAYTGIDTACTVYIRMVASQATQPHPSVCTTQSNTTCRRT